jgi:hypothetical protein
VFQGAFRIHFSGTTVASDDESALSHVPERGDITYDLQSDQLGHIIEALSICTQINKSFVLDIRAFLGIS